MEISVDRFGIPKRKPPRNNRALWGGVLLFGSLYLQASGEIFKRTALETVNAQITNTVKSKSPDDPCNTQKIKDIKIPFAVPYFFGLVSFNGTAVTREQNLNSRAKKLDEPQIYQGDLFELSTTDVKIFPDIRIPYRSKDQYVLRCSVTFTSELN